MKNTKIEQKSNYKELTKSDFNKIKPKHKSVKELKAEIVFLKALVKFRKNINNK